MRKMILGLLAFGIMVGSVAAAWSLFAGASFLVALGVYAASGSIAALALGVVVAMRRPKPPVEAEPVAYTPAE
ncbi:MAG: hypothetical protein AAFR35_05205 [Pseudomonadota bacterium]